MVTERDVQRYLVQLVKALGGAVRKVRWENHVGAPDILVMLPEVATNGPAGVIPSERFLVEVKAPKQKPRVSQTREHAELRKYGWRIEVVDCYDRVDEILFR